MSKPHHSWYGAGEREFWKNREESESVLEELKVSQLEYAQKMSEIQHKDPELIVETQYDNTIPVFDAVNLYEKMIRKEEKIQIVESLLYDIFFNGSGCFILRNCFITSLMSEFNGWCEEMLSKNNKEEKVTEDPGFHHRNQRGKYMINDVLSRMANTNQTLLYNLFYNNSGAFLMHSCVDALLGFAKFGAAAAHWITPNSNTRQASHVDFPLNMNSSPFWGMSEERMKRFTTMKQMNLVLPHHSCQVLIAADNMDQHNGSTEVIPCSQNIVDADLAVKKGSSFYEGLENSGLFQNVKLNQGDVLFFNRRLIHRGGANKSQQRRNALILQYVWLWGVGQEIFNNEIILDAIEEVRKKIKDEKQEENVEKEEEIYKEFVTRIQPPCPKDTR